MKYFLLLFFPFILFAQTPLEKGLEIVQKVRLLNKGYGSEKSSMKMILIDAYGVKTEREMEGKVFEVKNDGDKSISLFLNPLDVKGVKMITWSHKEDDDDQWLYLPSLKRVKRISSSGQSASFMGSEFSFEDLGSQELEKFVHKWLRDEKILGEDIWVIERTPKRKSSYSKEIIFMSQNKMNPLKIEYYDRKEQLLKIAEFFDYKLFKINGKDVWKANKIVMKNIQTKKESQFIWNTRDFNVKFSESEFDSTSLL